MHLVTNDIIIEVEVIKIFRRKLFGLINKSSYPKALLFYNVNAIHTFGMKMDIDIIYLDKDYNILGFLTSIKKNKILMPVKGVKHIIELDSKLINNKYLYKNIILKNKV